MYALLAIDARDYPRLKSKIHQFMQHLADVDIRFAFGKTYANAWYDAFTTKMLSVTASYRECTFYVLILGSCEEGDNNRIIRFQGKQVSEMDQKGIPYEMYPKCGDEECSFDCENCMEMYYDHLVKILRSPIETGRMIELIGV